MLGGANSSGKKLQYILSIDLESAKKRVDKDSSICTLVAQHSAFKKTLRLHHYQYHESAWDAVDLVDQV